MDEALYCDNCGYYPLKPENAHFRCPSCHARTSCCEGMPLCEPNSPEPDEENVKK